VLGLVLLAALAAFLVWLMVHRQKEHTSRPAVVVVTQNPAAGRVTVQYVVSSRPVGPVVANSNTGARVQLQVSAGSQPKPVTSVPDVTAEDAQNRTTGRAGGRLHRHRGAVAGRRPEPMDGTVTYETPTRAPRGSAIVVFVGFASP
jgi:hypothetical protein